MKKNFILGFLALTSVSSAFAENIFDVPSQCTRTMQGSSVFRNCRSVEKSVSISGPNLGLLPESLRNMVYGETEVSYQFKCRSSLPLNGRIIYQNDTYSLAQNSQIAEMTKINMPWKSSLSSFTIKVDVTPGTAVYEDCRLDLNSAFVLSNAAALDSYVDKLQAQSTYALNILENLNYGSSAEALSRAKDSIEEKMALHYNLLSDVNELSASVKSLFQDFQTVYGVSFPSVNHLESILTKNPNTLSQEMRLEAFNIANLFLNNNGSEKCKEVSKMFPQYISEQGKSASLCGALENPSDSSLQNVKNTLFEKMLKPMESELQSIQSFARSEVSRYQGQLSSLLLKVEGLLQKLGSLK